MFNAINFTSFTPANGSANSINSNSKKYVDIDGKKYPVRKVQDSGNFSSIMPKYKEVIVVDGKQYDVNEVSDAIASDKTKKVVSVDGQQYDVKTGFGADLGDIFNFASNK